MSIPLLSAVDTALVGHLDEVFYLGAIAVGGMIFNFIYWGFGFLRMGTTGLTAQAYGQGVL
ncbi:MAG: MATE family efflux transporter [Balneolales bacterium]